MSNLFEPIPQLKLSDTFYTWWETTNAISAALNPLEIYDVNASYGITITKNSSGVATFSVDAGCGLKFDGNTLTVDIREATEDANGPNVQDFFLFERAIGSTDNYPNSTNTTDCETLRKVRADQILPATVQGSHTFSGAITVNSNFIAGVSGGTSSMQLRSNSIRIGSPSGSTAKTAIDSIGFFIDTTGTGDDPNWIFRGDLSAWYTNQNIGISYDQAFVSDGPSGSTLAKFNFAPVESSQQNTQINLLMGTRSADSIITTDTDASISMTAKNSTNSLVFAHTSNDGSTRDLFSSQYNSGSDYSVFTVHGRMVIADVQNSTPFISTKNGSAYQIPVTTTDGILNYNFTNRISTTSYTGVVGNVVRFNGTNYVPAQANTETNSKIVGIIESISGGRAVIVLSGVFDGSSIVAGTTYYLDQQTPGAVTSTKPTSGLIKEVYVGLSTTSGMLFSSATSTGPTFSNVQITGDDLVTADVFGDTLTLTAGANITIERNTNNDILISAGTLAEAQYFSTIDPDGLTNIQASSASDTLRITGERGIYTYRNESDELVIRGGRSFAVVQVLGQNTNELDYTVQAITGEDTLYLRSGVGINITSSTDNDILIEATGVSVPADESITNAKLADMQPFSIKAAQANGRPVDVYDISDRLSSQNYVISGTGTLGDPTIFTDLDTNLTYQSVQSISGDTVLAEVPNEYIAGYVYGRWTDEQGIISEIQPLGRTELRSILGASPTGFLEENGNLFNSWFLYQSNGTQIASQTATGKSGELVFIAGNNITLSKVGTGAPDYKPFGIKIDASGDLGFSRIVNNRTGIDILSGDTSGVIEITDYGAVSVTVDSNNGLTFDVKPESITNEMLANMPFNSIKASVYNTDEPNPIDLVVGTNNIVGRGSGNLKALSASETREIIGLSSSYYFKTFTIENSSATTIGTINAASGAGGEVFTLRAGTNITLSQITGTNIFTISSLGGSTGGINTIAVEDIGGDSVNSSQVSSLTFGLVDLVPPSGYGSSISYKNIDYIPTGPVSNAFGIDIDLGLMPQCSIKVASSSQVSRHGASGYPAANFVLAENHLLYRSSNVLTSGTLSTIANNTGGIAHITNISDGSKSTAVLQGPKTLTIKSSAVVPSTISVDTTVSGSNLIFELDAITRLQNDPSPLLNYDLNVNGKFIIAPSNAAPGIIRRVAEFTHSRNVNNGSGNNSSYFVFNSNSTITGNPALIGLGTETIAPETSVADRDIYIRPQGSGKVIIDRITSTGSNVALSLTGARNVDVGGTGYLLNQSIYLLSGAGTNVTVGTLGSGNIGKGLYFFASQMGTNNSGSKDIGFIYTKNDTATQTSVSEIGKLITRGNNNQITLFTTTDLVLAAGVSVSPATLNNGAIPTGTGNIQFNSDILLSAKSIKAANNNITIDTGPNDFTGALVLKSLNKSGYHRVKSGQYTQNNALSKILEEASTSTSEKVAKYMLYMQDATTSTRCALVEFNVLINGDVRGLQVISSMKNGISESVIVLLDSYPIVPDVNSGTSNPTVIGAACGNNPTPSSGNYLIKINECLTGTFNYTLYKMSIQA